MTKEELLARKFHDIYERLAPSFGYATCEETQQFKLDTPNGRLMIAVCKEILTDESFSFNPTEEDEFKELDKLLKVD